MRFNHCQRARENQRMEKCVYGFYLFTSMPSEWAWPIWLRWRAITSINNIWPFVVVVAVPQPLLRLPRLLFGDNVTRAINYRQWICEFVAWCDWSVEEWTMKKCLRSEARDTTGIWTVAGDWADFVVETFTVPENSICRSTSRTISMLRLPINDISWLLILLYCLFCSLIRYCHGILHSLSCGWND